MELYCNIFHIIHKIDSLIYIMNIYLPFYIFKSIAMHLYVLYLLHFHAFIVVQTCALVRKAFRKAFCKAFRKGSRGGPFSTAPPRSVQKCAYIDISQKELG